MFCYHPLMKQGVALGILKTGKNVFLTGQAGAGKTYVLNQYTDYLKRRGINPAITASTGIAATHIGGTTIHSWSGLGITQNVSDYQVDAMQEKKYLWKRFENVEVLVLDEISMITAELLDSVDRVLKGFKRSQEPFGGIQVIFSGDFFQLPPIDRERETPRYAWHASSWKSADLQVCYLTEQFRQNEKTALNNVLNDIRDGEVSEESMNFLRSRYKKEPDMEVEATKLYTHNVDVDRINAEALEKLEGYPTNFDMKTKGNPKLTAGLTKSVLAPAILSLKENAHVIFVKNNYEKGYMNGSVGFITGFSEAGWPLVELVDGRIIEAEPEVWSIDDNGKSIASVSQVPLRLAWAITIHKSQGMSLDAAEIDLTNAFASGQGYVALSRLRSLEGLKLMGLGPGALAISPEVRAFDEEAQEHSEEAADWYTGLNEDEQQEWEENFIDEIGGSDEEEVIAQYEKSKKKAKEKKQFGIGETYLETADLVKEEYDLEEIAVTREISEDTVIKHLLVLRDAMPDLEMTYLSPGNNIVSQVKYARKEIEERAAEDEVFEDGNAKLKPIFRALDEKVSYTDIKLANIFM